MVHDTTPRHPSPHQLGDLRNRIPRRFVRDIEYLPAHFVFAGFEHVQYGRDGVSDMQKRTTLRARSVQRYFAVNLRCGHHRVDHEVAPQIRGQTVERSESQNGRRERR